MTSENGGGVTLIGMHTLESLAADGMLPQLQALASRPRNQWTFWNVVAFPSKLARAAGSVPAAEFGADAANGKNVIALHRKTEQSPGTGITA